MKIVLIAGINCQDGAYLVELLLEKGYQVPAFASFGGQARHNQVIQIINQQK